MSSKITKRKKTDEGVSLDIIGQFIDYSVAFIVSVMCIVVAFYAEDGYRRIGDAKFEVYKIIMIPGLSFLIFLGVLYVWFTVKEKRKPQISVTDWFVFAYLVLTCISVASGGFYEEAVWGSPGWNMGLLAQISFVLLYLFLSRFGRYYRIVLTVLCGAAAGVFLLGVLNRLQIDLLGFYHDLTDAQKAQFLSTLGQATWYASFMAAVLPVLTAVFLYTEKQLWRTLGGIGMAVGFCSLVSQNSDSAYVALAGFMLVFFWVSVEKEESLRRFLYVCTAFLASGKLMYFLMKINPNPALEYDFVTDMILTSGLTWILLGVCLFLCLLPHIEKLRRKNAEKTVVHTIGKIRNAKAGKSMKWVRRCVLAAVCIWLMVMTALIVLQTKGSLPAALSEKFSSISYFNWNDEWGNGRGKIWNFAVKLFVETSLLHKLFGVGPDCFNSYVTTGYYDYLQLYWGEKLLTNAHNEWLTMLIDGGIFGAAAYIGIFVTAIYRFMKKKWENFLLVGIAASAVSYMAYNFFCYQQVLCTPFIFILLGVGEYICREGTDCC